MTELLPCPFCGQSANMEMEPCEGMFFATCSRENCCEAKTTFGSKENATGWWNTRASLPLSSPSEWLPIETAPKDATWILIWDADYNKSYIARCTTDGMATSGDWDYEHKRATHWMNLPKPPRSLK